MRLVLCPSCQGALASSKSHLTCLSCGWERFQSGRRWLANRWPEPVGFDRAAAERLLSLENHFWSKERRYLIKRLLPRMNCPRVRAVELGCGTGSLLPLLEAEFEEVVAVDGHATLLSRAEEETSSAILVQADVCHTPLPQSSVDFVMALDVIEHVDPDALLAEARRLVGEGGMLLASAPAGQRLWSTMDCDSGHRCRYSESMMREELVRNGWTPVGFTHYQCVLYPLVWLSSRLGTRSGSGPERHPPAWLNTLLGAINRAETVLSGANGLPFGTSVLMWARLVRH